MSVVTEEAVLAAAEASDLRRFQELAAQLPGGLERAQEIVRTRGNRIRPGGDVGLRGGGTSTPRPGRNTRATVRPSRQGRKAFTHERRLHAEPTVEVRLHEGALAAIKRSVLWGTGQDGKETGGWLSGVSLPKLVAAFDATSGLASDVKRREDGMSLSTVESSWLSLQRRWGDQRMTVGTFHSHPGPDSRGHPSEADVGAMEAAIELGNIGDEWLPTFTSIIVTADEGRWSEPYFTAWVTRVEGAKLITEPGRLSRL
jgi:hypothetical protein